MKPEKDSSNLTNKYNPQEHIKSLLSSFSGSNLTNKYNPQERDFFTEINY